jgi:hypothetical protein
MRAALNENLGAFQGCSGFTGLQLSKNLTHIGGYAFDGCSGMTGELTIPNSVETIGDIIGTNDHGAVFRNCGFTSLVMGSNVKTIRAESFLNCSKLRGNLVLYSVEFLGADAFKQCGFDGTLTLNNGLHTIKKGAFAGCSSLVGNLVIPNTVTTMEEHAFAECRGFNGTLKISEGLTTLAGAAFLNCSGFTGTLTIPNSVTEIWHYSSWGTKEGCFEGCTGFDKLVLGTGLTLITNRAFKGCTGLDGILEIPANVKTIGNDNRYDNQNTNVGAFTGCTGLDGLILHEGLDHIHQWAFYGCTGMRGNLIIPNSVRYIDKDVFNECGFDGQIILGNSLIQIGHYAFANIENATGNLAIPNSVQKIDDNAFIGCNNIGPKLVIGSGFTTDNTTYIGANVFKDCYSISEVDIASATSYISKNSNLNQLGITSVDNALIQK